jgi:arylsulfatase A-like enzyme
MLVIHDQSKGDAMRFRNLVSLILLIVPVCALTPHGLVAASETPARPNILFIYADDHSPKTLSCYERAYPMAKTPHIDALAASGVRFQGAYLGSWCMPSRASLLTGHHPHAIESMRMEGPYPGSEYDPQQCRFWPAVFRQNGYQTAQIGKWHTGTDTGQGRDWDFQIVWNRPKNPENASRYYGPQVTEFNGEERIVEGYSTDNYTEWAIDYIRGKDRDADKPWYLWLCYGAIHGPTTPAPRHKGQYKDQTAEPPASIFGPRPGKPSYLDKTQAWSKGPDGDPVMTRGGKTYNQWLQQVNECMLAVDEGVGKLIEALRESGQLENTLIVYTSDQGFGNGEHGLRQKVAPYDAAYCSPLIVSQPGTLPAGKFCRHTVNAPDVVVTFFAQAGIELPWKMHGRDFTPLLRDPENAKWERPTLFEHTGRDYGSNVTKAVAGRKDAVHTDVPYYAALRQGRYKYVRYLAANEPEELYDLEADPEELTNQAADPRRRSIVEQFRRLLLEELRHANAGFIDAMIEPKP